MLAFEQFSGFALRRMAYANNMVAFIGDEFQQYASERAVNFFALSRQAKIIPDVPRVPDREPADLQSRQERERARDPFHVRIVAVVSNFGS